MHRFFNLHLKHDRLLEIGISLSSEFQREMDEGIQDLCEISIDGTIGSISMDGTLDSISTDGIVDSMSIYGTTDSIYIDVTIDSIFMDRTIDSLFVLRFKAQSTQWGHVKHVS